MSMRLLTILVLAICVASPAGWAEEYRFGEGKILVADVWVRASKGEESAVFMTIRNDGDYDRLTWVEPSFGDSATVEIVDEDVKLLDSIPLPGHGAVTELSPSSRYVMALTLTKPIEDGMRIAMRIAFWHAGIHEIQVPVRAAPLRRVAKCQSEALVECGHQRFDRELERRRQNR